MNVDNDLNDIEIKLVNVISKLEHIITILELDTTALFNNYRLIKADLLKLREVQTIIETIHK